MSSRPLTPPLAITGMSIRRARSTVASMLQPLSRPSRPISVNSRLATPASSKRRASRPPARPTLRPSPRSRPCRRAHRPRRRCRLRHSRAMSLTNCGILERGGAHHDARDAEIEPALDRLARADAAAELDVAGKRFDDRFHRLAVLGLAGKGAVEIDHMQVLAPRPRQRASPAPPGRRRRRWRASMSPSARRTTWPPLRSMAGKTIIGFHSRKRASSARP